MAAKKKSVERHFPLLDDISKIRQVSLINPDDAVNFKICDYIKDNLKHQLRPYQADALFSLNYTQTREKPQKHLMFNMATGSGKTDVMAAVMLYMYAEHGYRNFIFVANSNAVVSKTRDNFINDNSSKYLFNSPINIDGRRVEIKSVDRFTSVQEPGIIYMKLTTIQALSNELGIVRENGLTYEELQKNKVVILADEAHHFNASTKSQKQEENSWESLLDKVRECNSSNRQFEFTATIDVDKDAVYEKYRDKIVYKYDLNRFMEDGYSKNVYRLEADNDDRSKMMNAVLLSQYRKRIAKENGIDDFKPVILFKSNRIAASENARNAFLEMIDKLDVFKLDEFLKEQNSVDLGSTTLKSMYTYWQEQDSAQTVIELKRDFKPMTTINVNDTSKDGILGNENDFKKLNTLEDTNNPIRAVFAVAKLTEGWDVLNLYDIVRLGEQPVSLVQTNSEAQLIGRGARYNPFEYNGEKSYIRRFDNSNDPRVKLLESLHYHTINDSKYISNLLKSFNKMNLISESDSDKEYNMYYAKVKDKFKKSHAYKYGRLYHNKLKEVSDDEYNDLGKYGLDREKIVIDMVDTVKEHSNNQESNEDYLDTRNVLIADFNSNRDKRLLKKAMSRDKFFRFNELSKYAPKINSLNEFMTSSDWLGDLKVYATIPYHKDDSFDNVYRLKVVDKALSRVKNFMQSNYMKRRGTREFEPVKVKDIVVDYSKRISKGERSTGDRPVIRPYEMGNDDWFVYDRAIVDGLEKRMIDSIRRIIFKLKEKYKEVFLIRNEETISKLKLYEFENSDGITHYAGFLPDFLLYLDDGNETYQLFIEPKGTQLIEKDKWKEKLLENIKPQNIKLFGETGEIKLYGLKFYTPENGQDTISEIEKLTTDSSVDYESFKLVAEDKTDYKNK